MATYIFGVFNVSVITIKKWAAKRTISFGLRISDMLKKDVNEALKTGKLTKKKRR